MNKILLISLAIFVSLIALNGVNGMTLYCGDGYCDSAYYENDPLSEFYCPADCGTRVNETWCETTYPRDCPTCPTCGTCLDCTTSRIPTTDLANWCGSNGYVASGTAAGTCSTICPFPFVEKLAVIKITGNKCKDGLIILGSLILVGGIAGGYAFKKKKKRR